MASTTENDPAAASGRPATVQGGTPPGLLARVSWGAIIAGGVVALALMVLFSLLGFGIGFGVVNPLYETEPFASLATVGGIYFVVMQLVSLFVGGFVAARLAGVNVGMTAGLHGFSVWAVTTITLVFLGVSGASSVIGGLTGFAGSTISSATDALEEVVPADLPRVDLPDVAMRDLPEPVRETLREQGVTPERLTREVRGAFYEVVSEEELANLREEIRTAAAEIIRSPGDIEEDLAELRRGIVGGEDAVLGPRDLQEAESVVQERLGLAPDEARRIVERVEQGVEATAEEVGRAIRTARQEALEAAQATTEAVSNSSLMAFVASLLGLLACVAGGVVGRPKRTALGQG